MEIYVKKFLYFHSFSIFFLFSNTILSDALILPVSQLQSSKWGRHKLGHT